MPTPTTGLPSATVTTVDVAIVGAGPAGGAAALQLSGGGLRIALVEKAVPPRYKTCGGGVLWRAVKLLPIGIREAVERECRVVELVHHDPSLKFTSERKDPIVSMVMRDQFDHLLIRAAVAVGGVQMIDGTTVVDVATGPDGISLTTSRGEIRARFLIAADGVNSVVARKTNRPALRNVIPALECEATFAPDITAPFTTAARFDFGLVPAGYGWVFPKRDHLSIGVGSARRGAVNLNDFYRRYVDAIGLTTTPLHESRHGYMIPCHPREKMFEVPRVLFAGDAAGLADPITAEGITAGILSGQLAAQAIVAGNFNDASVRRIYRTTLDSALLADLRVARCLAWLMYERPRWFAALLARHGCGMSELMTRIVMGETTYRAAVRRPSHYLKLLTGSRPRIGAA